MKKNWQVKPSERALGQFFFYLATQKAMLIWVGEWVIL